MRAQIPNALSVSRIVLAVLVILISARLDATTYVITSIMLLLALLTDALDGYLARRWNVAGELGYVLDAMGDRAIHLALLLVFLVRYHFHPIFIWLVIFRDIGIYAVRVLSKDWLRKSREMRRISVLNCIFLRIWLGLFIVRDGFRAFTGADRFDTFAFWGFQMTILCVAIVVSYYGLSRSLGWLIDRDHETA